MAKKSYLDKLASAATRPIRYQANIIKEGVDVAKAWSKAQDMGMRTGAGTDAAANRLRAKQDKQMGQLFGAILQGRRYDNKTGAQIKAPVVAKKLYKKTTTKKTK